MSELKEAADRLASALADVDEEELVADFKELRRRGKDTGLALPAHRVTSRFTSLVNSGRVDVESGAKVGGFKWTGTLPGLS